MSNDTPLCRNCTHYYITHDPARPYGCRAMRFRSSRNPAKVVLETSAIPCKMFAKETVFRRKK